MKIRGALFAAVSISMLSPALAYGQDQPWLADRRYTEGMGYRVGNFELHPGLALEFGYDSNFLRRADDNDAAGGPAGAMRLRLTPSFSISTLGPQRRGVTPNQAPPTLEFSAGISATYNEFFPVAGADKDKATLQQQRNIGGLFDVRLNVLPTRPWSGAFFASVGRLVQPSQEGQTDRSYNRITPSGGAEIVWNPNGGMLDWRLGYNINATVFESSQFSNLTNLYHTLQTRGRWRFLPRSAAIYDLRVGFIQYLSPTEKTNSTPIRAQIGYNGLITPNFGAMIMAGYGGSFYQSNGSLPVQDFDSVIGQAEIRYFLTPTASSDPNVVTSTLSSVTLGFLRDFYDAYLGTYYERDRGYLKLTYFFGGRLLVVVDGGVGPLVNPAINTPTVTTPAWTDIRVDASAFAEYRFKDAFGINTTLRYNTRISDKGIPIPGFAGANDKLQYQQFEAYLGARWLM